MHMQVHMADYPCHGSQFHNGVTAEYDKHMAGDKLQRNVKDILEGLQDICRIDVGCRQQPAPLPSTCTEALCHTQSYYFAHTTMHTKKMVQQFREV